DEAFCGGGYARAGGVRGAGELGGLARGGRGAEACSRGGGAGSRGSAGDSGGERGHGGGSGPGECSGGSRRARGSRYARGSGRGAEVGREPGRRDGDPAPHRGTRGWDPHAGSGLRAEPAGAAAQPDAEQRGEDVPAQAGPLPHALHAARGRRDGGGRALLLALLSQHGPHAGDPHQHRQGRRLGGPAAPVHRRRGAALRGHAHPRRDRGRARQLRADPRPPPGIALQGAAHLGGQGRLHRAPLRDHRGERVRAPRGAAQHPGQRHDPGQPVQLHAAAGHTGLRPV
ncbi:MAG: hypothetical protein AVDCRST_MAG68-5529, partial [uncultured Gemmatimonadetes bacterium]